MKLYVSDKDIKENDLNFIEDEFIEKYWLLKGDSEDGVSFDVYDDVGLVEIKSLEQHEAEIRKPLEDEIERLKKENKQLIKDNRLLDETKYTAQQDDIDFFVEQERQKIIEDLEEWALKEKYSGWTTLDKLKQKLNEMKGETK